MIKFLFRSFSEASAAALKKRTSIGRLIGKELKDKIPTASSHKQQQSKVQLYPIIAACTAESFDFTKLLPFLQKNYTLSPFICDDVLHVTVPDRTGELFFFKNGSLVFWSSEPEVKEEALLAGLKANVLPKIKPFEVTPFDEPDFEELEYKLSTSARYKC